MAERISDLGPKTRVRILDILRGVSVISMVAYHTMYDVVWLFGMDVPWYKQMPGYLWQQSICWMFILVSGASVHYGRSAAKRGLLVLGCGVVVSLVTMVAMPGERIAFGILHFMGSAMLLTALAKPLLKKVPPVLGLAVCAALFVLTRGVPAGYLGLLDMPLLELPRALYSTQFLFPLGLPGPGFWSSDYFSIVPWIFLFWTGWFGWALLAPRAKRHPAGANPVEWVGRHSLLIYMLHQPVVYGVLLAMNRLGVLPPNTGVTGL